MARKIIFTFLLLIMITSASQAQLTKIDEIVKESVAQHRLPGIAVAIIKGNEVLYQKAYGMTGDGHKLTPQTPMFIGSISKSFTALAVMQLVEKGDIELDLAVTKYIPWFTAQPGSLAKMITVRHLLNHKSGFSDRNYRPEISDNAAIEESVQELKQAELQAKPGESFNYFNSNYEVLGLIIENVTGMSYEEYIKENILNPLDMQNTFLNQQTIKENVAKGHGAFFGFPIRREQNFKKYALPSGYIVSNLEDMSHFMIAQQAGIYKDQRILSKNGIKKMHSPLNGKKGYAMGWFANHKSGEKIVRHGGSLENYSSEVVLIPDRKYGIVILINQNHFVYNLAAYTGLTENIINLLIAEKTQKILSMKTFFLILLLVALITIIKDIYQIINMEKWTKKMLKKSKLRRRVNIFKDFLIPVILLFGIPAGIEAILNRGFSFKLAFNLVPDFVSWFIVISFLSISKGILKIKVSSQK